MDKITVSMLPSEYKKFLAYKEAEKIARSIRRGIKEAQKARESKCRLKSAFDLADEL
ncbi:MAG: hypothetical protein LBH32_09150 [Dysgonamonadaceae bacterium]|nr:hypothetical protein [Dysgonamonadaceae bacterium]